MLWLGTTPAAAEPELEPFAESSLERGINLFKQREFAAAAKVLEQAQTDSALHTEVLLLLGISYYRLGDFSRAEPLLRQVAQRGDAEAQATAQVFLGLLFQEQGAFDQARSELGRVIAPGLRNSAQQILAQSRPQRLLFTLLVSPEYDGNVPLTDTQSFGKNPQASADGDMLFLASVYARPFSFGLFFGNALSYRQQFQQSTFNLLLNSTSLGYSYLGRADRFRIATSLNYAMLGGTTLYLDGDIKASYRRGLYSQLGLGLNYDGHYRDYRNSDFFPLTGFLQSLQVELSWGLWPQPISAGVGYQAVREQTQAPGPMDPLDNDFRAWAHGPTFFLRARPQKRLELAFYGTFLHRIFDYVPGPELPEELGIRRVDHLLTGDLSLTVHLVSWLDLFAGSTLIYNDSNKAAFTYFKPLAYLGISALIGVL